MASIALTVAGSFLGPAGAAIGSLIGSYIDRQFLIPAILGQPDEPSLPTLDGLRVPSFDEGTPAPHCLGRNVRVTGQVISVGGLSERRVSYERGAQIVQDFFTTVTVAVARMITDPANAELKQVLVNGETIFNADSEIEVTGFDISLIVSEWQPGSGIVVLEAPANGSDLSVFKANEIATVSGFFNANNNGDYLVLNAVKFANGVTSLTLSGGSGAQADEAAGAIVTVYSNTDPIVPDKAASVTFYPGGPLQVPDPLEELIHGTGNVNAFRGTARVVIEDLKVTKYGGSIPKVDIVWREKVSRTIVQAIEDLCTYEGELTTADLDTTLVDDGPTYGLVWRSDRPPKEILAFLLLAHDILATEFDGKIVFISRANLPRVDLPADFLGASDQIDGETDLPARITIEEVDPPTSLTVAYQNPRLRWQPGSRTMRAHTGLGESSSRVSLPMAIFPEDVEPIAKRLLYAKRTTAARTTVSAPPSMMDLRDTDIVSIAVPADAEELEFQLEQIDVGSNGLVRGAGIEYVERAYNHTGDGTDGGDDDGENYYGLTFAELLDLPPLSEGDVGGHVLYYAVYDFAPTGDVPGGIFERLTGETDWSQITSYSALTTVGVTLGALGTAEPYYPDEYRTVDVRIFHGQPSSVTTSVWRSGGNRWLIGDEILDVRDVTQIDTTTYRLSGLRRGRLNTEAAISGHASGELAILLDSERIYRRTRSPGFYPSIDYVAVTNGFDIDDMTDQTLQLNGESVLAWSVWNLRAVVDQATGNITITWGRRIPFYPMLSGVRDATGSTWNITIRWNFDDSIIRQQNGLSDTVVPYSAVYLKTQQNADGVTPGQQLKIEIQQVSSDGRGGRTPVETVVVGAI